MCWLLSLHCCRNCMRLVKLGGEQMKQSKLYVHDIHVQWNVSYPNMSGLNPVCISEYSISLKLGKARYSYSYWVDFHTYMYMYYNYESITLHMYTSNVIVFCHVHGNHISIAKEVWNLLLKGGSSPKTREKPTCQGNQPSWRCSVSSYNTRSAADFEMFSACLPTWYRTQSTFQFHTLLRSASSSSHSSSSHKYPISAEYSAHNAFVLQTTFSVPQRKQGHKWRDDNKSQATNDQARQNTHMSSHGSDVTGCVC